VVLVDRQIGAHWLVYLWCTELVHGCSELNQTHQENELTHKLILFFGYQSINR